MTYEEKMNSRQTNMSEKLLFSDGIPYSLTRFYRDQQYFKVVMINTETSKHKIVDVYCKDRSSLKELILSWNRPAFYDESPVIFRAMSGEKDFENVGDIEHTNEFKEEEVLSAW